MRSHRGAASAAPVLASVALASVGTVAEQRVWSSLQRWLEGRLIWSKYPLARHVAPKCDCYQSPTLDSNARLLSYRERKAQLLQSLARTEGSCCSAVRSYTKHLNAPGIASILGMT